MNWKQIHTSSTHQERVELLVDILHVLEHRQHRILLVNGRIIHERRRVQRWHYINDRRDSHRSWLRHIYLSAIIAILVLISTTTWLISLNTSPLYGTILIIFHNLILLSIWIIKPYRRLQPSNNKYPHY